MSQWDRFHGDNATTLLGIYSLGYLSGYFDFDLATATPEHANEVAQNFNRNVTKRTAAAIVSDIRTVCRQTPTMKVEAVITAMAVTIHDGLD